MNATICGLIDTLFKDTLDTIETRTMKEELLNNCLEHYQDLIGRGLSETEAIDAVVESLNGMKEIIDEYPKKPEAQRSETFDEKVKTSGTAPVTETTEEEFPAERIYNPDEIRSIRTNLRSNDVTVGRSGDGMIHVRCDEPRQIICDTNGSRLNIRVDSEWKNISKNGGMKPEEVSVKGILNFVGKVLNKVASDISTAGAHVYIDLPDWMQDEIELNSMSGDVEIIGCAAPIVTLHSTSGDIIYEAPENAGIRKISASTASGDIRISGNADEAEGSSISGDVQMNGEYRKVMMKSTSGDTRLNGCANDLYAHTVSGENTLTLRNNDAKRIEAASTSGSVDIELPRNTPSVHVSMKSVSGSTRCSFPDDGANASLQIHASSVSGSIRIS